MSEEVVRQTRSQKRALERDAAPLSTEPSSVDNESKKPKLDPSEPTEQTQNEPTPDPARAEDGLSQTESESKLEQEQSQLPPPLVSPLAAQPVKDEEEQTSKQLVEPSSDNRTGCDDKASTGLKTEQAVDARSRVGLTEPKTSSGLLAAGEVKATIKVEVQTRQQPVDMSISRGYETVC